MVIDVRWSVMVVLCAAVSAAAAGGFRKEIDLNGRWEALETQDADRVPGDGAAWTSRTVPELVHGDAVGGSRCTWYRRAVTVPAGWAGGRVVLRLGGARYHPCVSVDGRKVADRLDGWTPFEVDITDHVRFGGTHILAVRCRDWGATFADGYTIPADEDAGWRDLRRVPMGKIIAPIGGVYGMYGMWDEVSLHRRPRSCIDDVAITTAVRDRTLTVRGGVVSGRPGMAVRGAVMDGEKPVMILDATPVGKKHRWSLQAPFGDVEYWSPEHPRLYVLRLVLLDGNGKEIDRCDHRFGFRQLWTDGPDFVFNGVRRHLLASSGWPARSDQSREEVRAALQRIKDANCIAYRLHTQPWQQKWLEIADEVGIMIIEEGALWCDRSYAYTDERFWRNTRDHLRGMVRRDRNHPSLVMWSVENELLHCGGETVDPDLEKKLADLGRTLKEFDPSHLVTFEADLDPGGVADVIGLHYPHEMPENADYPNTADWLARTVKTGTGGGLMGSRRKNFHWDRKKPLYIGEYLWVPRRDYAPGAVFFGDRAYRDLRGYKLKAKAMAWRHQTIAYRRAGVSGLCPWTFTGSGGQVSERNRILYETQKEVYTPLAVFPRRLDTRFFAGETVERTVDIFNDTPETQKVSLRRRLGDRPAATVGTYTLAPAARRAVSFEVPMPSRAAETTLAVDLVSGGRAVHSSRQTIEVCPRLDLGPPAGWDAAVLDPAGSLRNKLAGLKPRVLTSPKQLAALDPARTILVVAPGILREKEQAVPVAGRPGRAARLRAYLRRGGRALVLAQETFAGLARGITPVDHASTMTFPVAAAHPLLAGLREDDFRFWRGDHYVSRTEIRRPARSGGIAPVVSGGSNAVAQGPIVDVPMGQGVAILCQAVVGEKLDTEPAARRLFVNALRYLSGYRPPAGRTVVLGGGDAFLEDLRGLGLQCEHRAGVRGPGDLKDAALVIAHGGGSITAGAAAALGAWLKGGEGRVLYWHAPEPAAFAAAASPLGAEKWGIKEARGPVVVRETGHRFFDGVCREDLVFPGASRGRSWQRGFEPNPGVIDRQVTLKGRAEDGERIEAETMALAGKYVAARGTEAVFATTGTATTDIGRKEAGWYAFALVGRGSPAAGVYPVAAVTVNGRRAGAVSMASETPGTFPLLLHLPGGTVRLGVSFVNDATVGGADRNLYLDAVVLSRDRLAGGGVAVLTIPSAVAAIPVGAGNLVVDGVRWDRTGGARGRRFANVLFRNLGAQFSAPAGVTTWIKGGRFSLDTRSPGVNRIERGTVCFLANGAAEAQFRCATGGRYELLVNGRSSPAGGAYARIRVSIDDKEAGIAELRSSVSGEFTAGSAELAAGEHRIRLAFINDLYRDGQDRNAWVEAAGLRLIPAEE